MYKCSWNSVSMLRTSREPADVWVLRLSAITMATRPRCLERATAARTCSQNTSAVRPAATRPSNQPSRQSSRPKPQTLRLSPGASRHSLLTSTLAAPHAREGRVKGDLHLILEIEVSAWHEREQLWQVGGKLTPQPSIEQIMNG